MSEKYTCEWYNEEKTIVIVRSLDSNWTWEEATEAIEAQISLAETVEHPVHNIFYFEERPNIQVSGAIRHLEKLMNLRAKNEDLNIFVNINRMFSSLLNTVSKIYKLGNFLAKYRFVDTLEEALEEIEQYEAAKNKPKAS